MMTGQPATMSVCVSECVGSLPQACKALFLEGERESFDLSAGWFGLMETHGLPKDARPLFYALSDAETCEALLPLFLRKATGNASVSGMTSFYSSLYRPLLAAGAGMEALAGLIRRVLSDSGANRLRFDPMDPDHPSFAVLEQALRLSGLLAFRFYCFSNYYLPTEGRTFAEYFQERPSQVRNTVRRRQKKFMAQGRGRLEILGHADIDLGQATRIWNAIYASSWKVPEPYPCFVPELMRFCAERGWLRLGIAYYDAAPVAAQLWIVSHGRAAIYKLAYDQKYSELSAGTLLTARLMEHVMDVDKAREVDYLVGDDAYKKDWMSHRRERWGIVAYNPRSVDGMLGALAQWLGIFRRRLMAGRAAGGPLDSYSSKGVAL